MSAVAAPARSRQATTADPVRSRSAPPLRLVPAAHPASPTTAAARRRFFAGVAVLLAAGLGVVLLLHTWAAQDSFTLTTLQHQRAQLTATRSALAEVDQRLESPARLRAAAVRLGMRPLSSPSFLTRPDGQVVVRGTPLTPASTAPATAASGQPAPHESAPVHTGRAATRGSGSAPERHSARHPGSSKG